MSISFYLQNNKRIEGLNGNCDEKKSHYAQWDNRSRLMQDSCYSAFRPLKSNGSLSAKASEIASIAASIFELSSE